MKLVYFLVFCLVLPSAQANVFGATQHARDVQAKEYATQVLSRDGFPIENFRIEFKIKEDVAQFAPLTCFDPVEDSYFYCFTGGNKQYLWSTGRVTTDKNGVAVFPAFHYYTKNKKRRFDGLWASYLGVAVPFQHSSKYSGNVVLNCVVPFSEFDSPSPEGCLRRVGEKELEHASSSLRDKVGCRLKLNYDEIVAQLNGPYLQQCKNRVATFEWFEKRAIPNGFDIDPRQSLNVIPEKYRRN
jgi:hypothetical protein